MSMHIRSDWHIHSRNSCDEACMTLADLVREASANGITDYGVTDHIHTPYHWPDIERSRAEFDTIPLNPRFHFGVEASCVSEWEIAEIATGRHAQPVYGLRSGGPPGAAPALALSANDLTRFGIEYVIGGTHWPLDVPLEREALIRDYHRQNLYLAAQPLVDIVAHPWWWHGAWQDASGLYSGEPWLDDFRKVPASMHAEFADAVRRHRKVVEINLGAMLLTAAYPERFKRQYLEYLAGLQARGVRLAIGSDCHGAQYAMDFARAADLLAGVGIREENLWSLPPRQDARGGRGGRVGAYREASVGPDSGHGVMSSESFPPGSPCTPRSTAA
jgi:histidinol phosphatase-like PHP family hydrolase